MSGEVELTFAELDDASGGASEGKRAGWRFRSVVDETYLGTLLLKREYEIVKVGAMKVVVKEVAR